MIPPNVRVILNKCVLGKLMNFELTYLFQHSKWVCKFVQPGEDGSGRFYMFDVSHLDLNSEALKVYLKDKPELHTQPILGPEEVVDAF